MKTAKFSFLILGFIFIWSCDFNLGGVAGNDQKPLNVSKVQNNI